MSGYRLSLLIAGAMVAAGGVVAWRSLQSASDRRPVTATQLLVAEAVAA